MSAGKGVVFAFQWRGERLDATELAVGAETVAASGKNLMGIGLMPHIPYDTVVGGAENIVQGDCEFYSAKTGCKVSGVLCQFIEDVAAEFRAEVFQLSDFEFPQIIRTVDG